MVDLEMVGVILSTIRQNAVMIMEHAIGLMICFQIVKQKILSSCWIIIATEAYTTRLSVDLMMETVIISTLTIQTVMWKIQVGLMMEPAMVTFTIPQHAVTTGEIALESFCQFPNIHIAKLLHLP